MNVGTKVNVWGWHGEVVKVELEDDSKTYVVVDFGEETSHKYEETDLANQIARTETYLNQ